MPKYKFSAPTEKYSPSTEVKVVDNSIRFDPLPDSYTINDGMNRVVDHLNDLLASPEPYGLLSNWFQRAKIDKKEQRLRAVESYVLRVRTINDQYRQLQAELFLNADVVRGLILRERITIKGELITAEQAIERQIADHRHYLGGLKHEDRMRTLREEDARADIAIKNAQAKATELEAQAKLLEAEAEAAINMAKAAREMELVELIKYVRENIKVSELPPEYQAFIMVSQFGSPLDAEKFKIAQELRDWFIRSEQAKAEQAEAKAEEMRAGAKSAQTEAEYIKYKRDRSMRDPSV